MRRSIMVSLLLVLATLGSAFLGGSGAGVAQESSIPDGVDIVVLGVTDAEPNERLALIEISIAPNIEPLMVGWEDDPIEAVFEITQGTLTISVVDGQVILVRDNERIELGPDDDDVPLVENDVLISKGAQFEIRNPIESTPVAQGAQRNFAQPDSDGTAKMTGALRGCRAFCPGP